MDLLLKSNSILASSTNNKLSGVKQLKLGNTHLNRGYQTTHSTKRLEDFNEPLRIKNKALVIEENRSMQEFPKQNRSTEKSIYNLQDEAQDFKKVIGSLKSLINKTSLSNFSTVHQHS